MNSKIKNIIIAIGVVLILAVLLYFFLFKKNTDPTLTSSSGAILPSDSTAITTDETAQISKDFLSLLLSVKSIKLNDSILKNQAFASLKDSSIVLTQDGNEGRTNPFAPIGYESMATTPTNVSPTTNTNTTTNTVTTDINANKKN